MEENNEKQEYLEFIKTLKSTRISYSDFKTTLTTFQEEATREGLDEDILNKLADAIINSNSFNLTKYVSCIKCLIPKHKMPEKVIKLMITWCLSSVNELPFNVSIIVIQWIIGLWDYELVDRKIINIYYDVFFHIMLKKERLERHIARLIYVLTKPEDVCRKDVLRLLISLKSCSTSRTHIVALLSLFKSYKPELVPEKIESVNIESVWRPIPEILRSALEKARDRVENRQSRQNIQTHFNWNVLPDRKVGKKKKALLPSIGYFHIGSSIFKDKDARSIFDIHNIEELGKYHNVELPCNVVSLLANMAGYHLLTYANFQYQSRFSYNLYNILTRAFIWENEKFSKEEMRKFLSMTADFSRYMQEGVLVVKLFFDEYLYYNTGEHMPELLDLLQWMTIISIDELRENILIHVQNIFNESTLTMKCEIIKALQKLITNLFVRQGFVEQSKDTSSSFLRQSPFENLPDIIPVITTFSENLIVHGLNVYNYNVILLSEALAFYEQICMLESYGRTLSWTLPPSAVIYGAFVTKSCAILSRVCRLLLKYRDMSSQLRKILPPVMYQEKIRVISIYAHDIHRALWYNEPFSGRKNGKFLKNLSEKVVYDLEDCDLDSLLSISNHYAVLPYKYTFNKMGLNITAKEDTMNLALYYYPAINEFLTVFQD